MFGGLWLWRIRGFWPWAMFVSSCYVHLQFGKLGSDEKRWNSLLRTWICDRRWGMRTQKKNLKPSPLFLREKRTIVQYVLCLMKPMIWQVVTLRLDYNIEKKNKKPWPHFRKEPALGKTTAKIEDVIQESAAFMYSC